MNKIVYSKGLGKLSLLEIISRIDRTNVGTKKSVPCYIVDDYAIISSTILCSDYARQDRIIDSVHKLADMGVNAVRLYGYVSDESDKRTYGDDSYCSAMFVMDKAPGQELYKGVSYSHLRTDPEATASLLSYMDMLANAPQEHYTKFVHDYMAILRNDVAVDPSKKGNFFYDPDKGFTFIDLRNPRNEIGSRFLATNMLTVISPYGLTEETRQDSNIARYYDKRAATILIKMDNALLANGFTREDIDECFTDRRYSDGIYASGMRFGSFDSVAEARDVLDNDSVM